MSVCQSVVHKKPQPLRIINIDHHAYQLSCPYSLLTYALLSQLLSHFGLFTTIFTLKNILSPGTWGVPGFFWFFFAIFSLSICIFWDFKRKFRGQPTLLLNIFPIKSSFSDISYPTWIDSEKFIENAYKTSCLKTEGTYLSQELLKSKQEFFLSMPAAALWRMINWMMRTLLLMSFRYPQQT